MLRNSQLHMLGCRCTSCRPPVPYARARLNIAAAIAVATAILVAALVLA